MSMSLRITGIVEFRKALKHLPDAMKAQAAGEVQAAAHGMAAALGAAYPLGPTGNLRRGVVVRRGEDPDGRATWAQVVSRAPHSHLYERGTAPRRWASGKRTGAMPAANIFVPMAVERRRALLRELVVIVERAGFTVTGLAA